MNARQFHFPPRWLWLTVGLLALIPHGLIGGESAAPTEPRTEVRFNFAKSMFTGVNENDAQAAMKVYAQTLGDQNGIYVSNAPAMLDGTNAIARAIEANRAEMFALTTAEFLALEKLGLEGPLLLSSIRQKNTEEYVLLSRADSSVRQPEDLKGRGLLVCNDVRSCLAPLWLDVLCREHGLGPAGSALGKMDYSQKPSQVVLPVFFGKADAGLVTRISWETMCELNPQLEKQLRVIAISPPVVPAITCFGPGFSPALKQQIFRAVELSSTKPSYRQLMELFKCDGVGYQPLTVLDSTRELEARHEKLCIAPTKTGPLPPASAVATKEALIR